MTKNKVAVIMGSNSDYFIMKEASTVLKELKVPLDELIVSAHKTPLRMYEFAQKLDSSEFGAVIAGAGGAAHLPGMVASLTNIPVLGVPIPSPSFSLGGIDSLLSIVQMPPGVPVATFAIGKPGAISAALHASAILATVNQELSERLKKWRENKSNSVKNKPS